MLFLCCLAATKMSKRKIQDFFKPISVLSARGQGTDLSSTEAPNKLSDEKSSEPVLTQQNHHYAILCEGTINEDCDSRENDICEKEDGQAPETVAQIFPNSQGQTSFELIKPVDPDSHTDASTGKGMKPYGRQYKKEGSNI